MNLIVCTTPFQMLIAEKIIELYTDEDFELHLFCNVKNEKYTHYFDRLSKVVKKSKMYVFDRKNKMRYLLFLIKLKFKSFLSRKIDRLFVGSIDSNHIHIHIHRYIHSNTKLYTFDDGTANIFPDSFFYKECASYKNRLLKYIFCYGTSLSTIKAKILKHYSIYSGKNNIVSNVEYIDLFSLEENCRINDINGKPIKILLGQPIYENISSKEYDELGYSNLIRRIIFQHEIDYYFPHPREDLVISGIEYIRTHFILEDYILHGIHDGKIYELYTFFSGGVLSFNNVKSVKVISLKLDILDLKKYYKIMEEFNNILFLEESI